MDYQGNYFPEEQDEKASKTYRTIKGIFKWTMYGISFLLYGALFVIIFINRDSKILETNYMSSFISVESIDTDDIELFRINAKEFMNDDGSLQLYNVDYSDEYNFIEMGVKFNANKLTDGDNGDCLDYELIDSDGNNYELVNRITDDGGRYGFSRLCFSGIDIDLDSNDLRYENNPEKERTDVTYTLIITHRDDKKEIHRFLVYDNSVTFMETDYEN